MASLNPLDARLIVTFYVDTQRNQTEEWVKILNPVDNSEHHARAASMSHRDPLTNQDVSYAERFPHQYAAFKTGKDKTLGDEEAELERKLAAIRQARRNPAVSDAAVQKAADEAAAAAALEAAQTSSALANASTEVAAAVAQGIVDATKQAVQKPDFEAMDDADLRDYITEKTGKAPGGNTKRETLIRAAQEV